MITGEEASEYMGDIMKLMADREGVQGVLVWNKEDAVGVLCSKMSEEEAAAVVSAILGEFSLDFTRLLKGKSSDWEEGDWRDHKPNLN